MEYKKTLEKKRIFIMGNILIPNIKETRIKYLEKNVNVLEKIEPIFSLKGCLRILFILSDLNLKLTYLEIQRITNLSLGTLNKALDRLKKFGLIGKSKEYRKYRNRKESVYMLTINGKLFCDYVFGYKHSLKGTMGDLNKLNKLKESLKDVRVWKI